jgi:murein L,D-transpeptidase YafK
MTYLRFLILGLSLLFFSACTVNKGKINHLVVHKSKREMSLYSDDQFVKKVPIALGTNPVAHKQREGDGRTPEGRYFISWRNPQSKYYLSLHISYPNNDDINRAKKQGHSPGGQIMIHGLPKKPKWEAQDYVTKDWTNGCIAVSNDVMDELFKNVVLNSPIDIYP